MAEPGKTGILLINLGTPDATDFRSMRRYLKQFLGDNRVIERKGLIWWLVLNGIILRKRPKSSGLAYDRIWNHQRNESPLKTITRAQADALGDVYAEQHDIMVGWAMRYGNPSIETVVTRMMDQGCTRLVVFPLYPQYSGATTGTAMDSVFDALKSMRHQPAIRTIEPYFDHPAYIDALASSINDHHGALGWKPEVTLASMHGLPLAFIRKGDPYEKHCKATVAALRDKLGFADWQFFLTYQSRSNRGEWLLPDTECTLRDLARDGIKKVTIVAPGFAADCVETLEELSIRASQAFVKAGGERLSVVPCLNDREHSIKMMKSLIDNSLF